MHARMWISLLMAVSLSACATTGQVPPPPVDTTKEDPVAALAKFTRKDVERGRDIAIKHGDKAGEACATAILAHIPEGGTMADMLQPVGVFSGYMFGRELHRQFRGVGVPDDVHVACAPLVIDAEMVAIRLGLIAVGAGALPSLPLPLSAPVTPGGNGFGR